MRATNKVVHSLPRCWNTVSRRSTIRKNSWRTREMKLSDYMSAEKFPMTSQSGLPANDQLLSDALRHDLMKEARDKEGYAFNEAEEAIFKELEEKMKVNP